MTSFAEEPDRSLSADGVLALAYLNGDERALAELYQRYYGDVVRIVRASVRDHALAEDIAQDAFYRAVRYLHRFDPTQPFWPWIRKIARGVTCSEMGRRGFEVPVDEVPREMAAPDIADTVTLQAAVMESLRLLPKRQRRALIMRYIEDRNANDIAALLGLSRNALEQLLLRARTSFAKDYRSRNIAVVPVFGPLVARLRRVLAGLGARLQHATGTGFSVAGDVALGAALTVGGIGIGVVAFGGSGSSPIPPGTLAAPGNGDVTGPVNPLVKPTGGGTHPTATVSIPQEQATSAQNGGPASAPPTATGTTHQPPVVAATQPPATPSSAPATLSEGRLPVSNVQTPPTEPPPSKQAGAARDVHPPPLPTPSPSAPPPPSGPPTEEVQDDPVPEPSIWVDDDGAGAVVHEDSSNTTGQAEAKQDVTAQGPVATGGGKSDVAGQTVGVGVTVSNSDDDGAVCYLFNLTCKK